MVITVGPHSASAALPSESDKSCIGLEDLDILINSILILLVFLSFLFFLQPHVFDASAACTGAVSAHVLILSARVNSRARCRGMG